MKALILCILFSMRLCAMDLEKSPEQIAKEQAVLQVAGKLKVEEGPDAPWHAANSFIQAVINPAHVEYYPNGIRFTHYKRAYLTYDASYAEIKEWLGIMLETPCQKVRDEAVLIISTNDLVKRLTELQKFRIAKHWLYDFLSDSSHSVYCCNRKEYLDALKAGLHTELPRLAALIARENPTTLINEIECRRQAYI